MEKFNITYNKIKDDFYDFYEFIGLEENYVSEQDEDEYCLKQISDLKEVILEDFKRILTYKIKFLENNAELVKNIENLLLTYQDSVYYNKANYMILTDDYLCFNNVKPETDGYLFGVFMEESFNRETIIIVDRSFTKYYFINKDTYLVDEKVKTTIEQFDIKGDKVESIITQFRGNLDFSELSEEKVKINIKKISRHQKSAK